MHSTLFVSVLARHCYLRLTQALSVGAFASMMAKLAVTVLYAPIFLPAAVFIVIFGTWLGSVYIKAQMSVKREMSNCKSPVLAVFGSAIHGLGE